MWCYGYVTILINWPICINIRDFIAESVFSCYRFIKPVTRSILLILTQLIPNLETCHHNTVLRKSWSMYQIFIGPSYGLITAKPFVGHDQNIAEIILWTFDLNSEQSEFLSLPFFCRTPLLNDVYLRTLQVLTVQTYLFEYNTEYYFNNDFIWVSRIVLSVLIDSVLTHSIVVQQNWGAVVNALMCSWLTEQWVKKLVHRYIRVYSSGIIDLHFWFECTYLL